MKVWAAKDIKWHCHAHLSSALIQTFAQRGCLVPGRYDLLQESPLRNTTRRFVGIANVLITKFIEDIRQKP